MIASVCVRARTIIVYFFWISRSFLNSLILLLYALHVLTRVIFILTWGKIIISRDFFLFIYSMNYSEINKLKKRVFINVVSFEKKLKTFRSSKDYVTSLGTGIYNTRVQVVYVLILNENLCGVVHLETFIFLFKFLFFSSTCLCLK